MLKKCSVNEKLTGDVALIFSDSPKSITCKEEPHDSDEQNADSSGKYNFRTPSSYL